jgi:beta-aspartyl-peptidase (threonine type)
MFDRLWLIRGQQGWRSFRTGYGESIIKVTLSRVVCELLEKGLTPQKAAEQSIKMLEKKINGRGGVIVLDRKVNVGVFYNTPKMAIAYMKEGSNAPTSSV